MPYRSNISGSHSYLSLLKKSHPELGRTDDSSSCESPLHVILISSRIPAYEVPLGEGATPYRVSATRAESFGCHVRVKMTPLLKEKSSDLVNAYRPCTVLEIGSNNEESNQTYFESPRGVKSLGMPSVSNCAH